MKKNNYSKKNYYNLFFGLDDFFFIDDKSEC